MSEVQFEIDIETGLVECVASAEALSLVEGEIETKRRVSHVEPVNVWLRAAFHVVRGLFGDEGAAGQWTRRWKCVWRVRMLVGSREVFGAFPNRDDAIAAELKWLAANWW